MDTNGVAAALTVIILAILGVYKTYPGFMAKIQSSTSGEQIVNGGKPRAKDKPTIANLNARIDDLVNDMKAVRQERDDAKKETGQTQERLQAEIDELKEKLEALRKQNEKAIADNLSIAQDRDKALKRNTELLEELNSANTTITNQFKEISSLEKRVTELEHQLAVNRTVDTIVGTLGDKLTNAIRDAIRSTGDLPKVQPGGNPS